MSALERISSIRRLVQRLTSRKPAAGVTTNPTSVIEEHVQRRRNLHPDHSRHYSHLPHLDQGVSQTESFGVDGQARRRTADRWDISDDPLDDDAVELHVDDSFVAQVFVERECVCGFVHCPA
jgi:hypothetical protein